MNKTKVGLIEPLVKHPIRINKNGKVGDVGLRLSLGYLAGHIREKVPSTEVQIVPYRLYELEGTTRCLERDLNEFDVIGITSSTTEFPDAEKIAKVAKKQENTLANTGPLN